MLYLLLALFTAAIVAVDQLTKYLAAANLVGKTVTLIPGWLQLHYITNDGMALSLLRGARWLFVVMTAVYLAVVIYVLVKKWFKKTPELWCIAAITGGAIGNFIDRISTGLVIDMICIPWFSTFNVADLFITFGALVLVIYILTKDKELLANKPKGLVVRPAPGHADGTLVNALLAHCGDSLSGIGGEKRPGIVHRIDKDTSGLIIAAKNDFAHAALAAQLKDHSLARTYVCIVCGKIKDDSGTIDAPIGRHPADRKKMAVTEKNSRSAVTHWRVLERFSGYTLVECKLETGRTHQIRVHMAYRGHPILGDMVYGHKKPELGQDSQCLHAKELRFVHPRTGQLVTVCCELPDYFTALLEKLRARA